jgi:hypothetical protein
MELSLHRGLTLGVKIGKPGESRAFVFDIALGITKKPPQVDADSGMIINLAKVDEVMAKLKFFLSSRDWPSFETLLNESIQFLDPVLATQGCHIADYTMTEKRGFYLGWNGTPYMGREQIVMLDGDLYRLKTKAPLQKVGLFQDLGSIALKELQSKNFFELHPNLLEIEMEQMALGEKTILRKI